MPLKPASPNWNALSPKKKVAEARGAAGDSHESLAIDVAVANRRVMPASTHTRRAFSKCCASLSAWTGGIPVRMTGSNGRPGRVGDTNRRHFGRGSMTCTKRPPANLGRFDSRSLLVCKPGRSRPTARRLRMTGISHRLYGTQDFSNSAFLNQVCRPKAIKILVP